LTESKVDPKNEKTCLTAERIRTAEELFNNGRIESARDKFLDILKEQPNCKEALNNLGVIDFQESRLDMAAQWFVRSLKIDPFYVIALLNYADLLQISNHLPEAIQLLEMAVARHPDDDTIRQRLAECRSRLNQPAPSPAPTKPISLKRPAEDPLAGKRVLHAPFEVAGNIGRITTHLRNRGVKATGANYYDNWLDYQCDINLKVNSLKPKQRDEVIDDFAREAISQYDIFHFHFAHSLKRDLSDLPLLKEKGKKILFNFWGSDSRGNEWILYQQARYLGHRPPRPYALTRDLYRSHKKINLYADVLFGLDNIPRGIWMRGHADTQAWPVEERDRIRARNLYERKKDVTYFVHAPSSNWKKGSSLILKALKECQEDGLPIEVIYVAKVPPARAREMYAYADYAIDQVGVGTYGLFGIEMMAWKIPVLVWHNAMYDRIRNNPPVIHITKENFKQQVERCIEMKRTGEMEQLGEQARKFVIENEDLQMGLDVYMQCYRDLLSGKAVPQLFNPAWYRQERQMEEGFKSEFYRYMIEQNVFEDLRLEVPDYDRELYL